MTSPEQLATSVEEFHRAVLLDGGRVRIFEMPELQRILAVGIEDRFRRMNGAIAASSIPQAKPWASSLRLDWVKAPTVNAIALCGSHHCHIGLYLGVLDQLRLVFLAFAAYPLIMEHEAPRGDFLGREETRSWLGTIRDLITGHIDPAVRARLDAFEAKDDPRAILATSLYCMALDFLLMHEIQHFWLGHVFGFEGPRKLGLTAVPSGSGARLSPVLRRALEMQADVVAVRRLVELESLAENYQAERFVRHSLSALAVLFMVLDPHAMVIEECNSSDYPHPHFRFAALAINLEEHGRQKLGLTDAEWDSALNRWLLDMAYVESGDQRVLLPFKRIASHSDWTDRQKCQYEQLLREHFEVLSTAQTAMWEYYGLRHVTKSH